ncbi:MAG: hypothetical protein ACRCTZ_07225 [Sarcina sp.]
MLIKILGSTLDGANSSLDIVLYNDALTAALDLHTLTPGTAFTDMLIFENITGVNKVIAFTYAFKTDGADGILTLAFDATNTVVANDVLSLRQGISVKSGILSRVQNTASISITGAVAADSTTTNESIVTPLTTDTADKNYRVVVNILTADGTTLSSTEYQTNAQFTVNGTPVYGIDVTLDQPGPFNTKTEITYIVTYKNELGEPLELQAGDLTTVSAYLKPII